MSGLLKLREKEPMSRSTTQALTCPCGEVFNHTIYEYVNVAKDPQLRYTVLAGLLNVATCPKCNRRAAFARPFIYSDPERRLLAYVHPRNDAPEEARMMILEKLRDVYESIVGDTEQPSPNGSPVSEASAEQIMATPPLQVVFGLDQLHELKQGCHWGMAAQYLPRYSRRHRATSPGSSSG